MSDFDLPALEMEARLKDFVSQNLETINGKIQEFGDKAETHFDRAGKASDVFTDKLDDLGRKIIGLFAAEKAFSFIKEGVAEFQAGALASAKLTQALGFQSEALNKIAEADSKVTLYKKEQLTSGEANLAFYIKDEAQLKMLVPTMEDLAVKTGSLDSAATLIGRTFNSNVTTMRGLGISVHGAAGSHERLDSIVKGLTERFGGQAKALSDSQGEYGQLKKNIEEISKAIGDELIPVLNFWSKKFLELKDSWEWILGHGNTDAQVEALNKQNIELSKSLQILTMLKTQGSSEGAYAMIAKGIADGNEKLSQRQKMEEGQIQQAQSELDHWKQVKSILDSSGGSIDNAIEKMTKFTSMVSKGVTKKHTKKKNTDDENGGGDDDDSSKEWEAWEARERALHEKLAQDEENIDKKSNENRKELLKRLNTEMAEQTKKGVVEYEKANIEMYKDSLDKNQLEIFAINEKYDKMEAAGVLYATAEKLRAEQISKLWKMHADAGLQSTVSALDTMAKKWHEFGNIYKAAAETENIINTYKAATAAYSSMAGVPYVGPVLGAEAAAVAIGAGIANGAMIASQSFSTGTKNAPGGFARVHQDETIFLPAHSVVNTKTESKNMGGEGATHFHFYGSTDSTTVDNIQSMLIEANRTGKLERFKAAIK
jgi:hypothetical protein